MSSASQPRLWAMNGTREHEAELRPEAEQTSRDGLHVVLAAHHEEGRHLAADQHAVV